MVRVTKQAAFDLIAPIYNGAKKIALLNLPERVIEKWVEKLPQAHHILVIGGGADNTVISLQKRFPGAEIVCVDFSKKMIDLAFSRWKSTSPQKKVTFLHANFLEARFAVSFDLVVCPFFLDLFNDTCLRQMAQRITEVASSHGVLAIMDFASKKHASNAGKVITHILYFFFNWVIKSGQSMVPDFAPYFQAHGWIHTKNTLFYNRVYQCQLFQLKK